MSVFDARLLPNPRGDAAKQLVALRSRRAELREKHREALAAVSTGEREVEQARVSLRHAEGREAAFGDGDVKAARALLAKAAGALAAAREDADRFAEALAAVEREGDRLVRANYDELFAEVLDDHAAGEEKAAQGLALLTEAHREMRSAYGSAALLTNAVGDRHRNALLRDPADLAEIVANGGALGLLGAQSAPARIVDYDKEPLPAEGPA